MRILHVVPSYIPAYRYGGLIYSVHGLCKALAARNHDVYIFTTNVDGPNDLDVPLGSLVNLDGVKVWYFPSKVIRRLYWSPLMAQELKRQMINFDIVHLHSIYLWPTWAAARTARHFHVPYILAPRGMLIKDVINRKSTLAKKIWIQLIERNNLEKASAIHVTTKIEELECKRFGFNLPPLYIVPNGIDLFPIKPLKEISEPVKKLINKQPLLLFLSRINWKKGLDRLIPALEYIPDAHFIVAGNDDENYTPYLKKLAKEHNVLERITFTGPVYGDDKQALFRAATVFVLPSYSENFGNVVLEAMAVKCPVVVTPEVGLAEVVSESKAGIVVNGEPHKIAEGLLKIIENDDTRDNMGKRGREIVKKRFSWNVVAEQMELFYHKTLELESRVSHA
jgi:glycosyltransferase involved in cell wall biosynthesis